MPASNLQNLGKDYRENICSHALNGGKLGAGTRATQAEAEVRLLPTCAFQRVERTVLAAGEWCGVRRRVSPRRRVGNGKRNLVLREETFKLLLSLPIEWCPHFIPWAKRAKSGRAGGTNSITWRRRPVSQGSCCQSRRATDLGRFAPLSKY